MHEVLMLILEKSEAPLSFSISLLCSVQDANDMPEGYILREWHAGHHVQARHTSYMMSV